MREKLKVDLADLFNRRQDDEEFDNLIYLSGDIDKDSARRIVLKILKCEQEDSKEDIFLVVNSPGGYIDDIFSIYDVIKTIKNPVSTICFGCAMSGAALLLAAGDKGKRLAGPSARVMIHEVSLHEFSGTTTILENETVEMRHINRKFLELIARESENDFKTIRDLTKNGKDYYMSAQQAKKLGIVDKILRAKREDGKS